MLFVAACAHPTGANDLFDPPNARTADEAKTIIDRVGQGPKRVPAAGHYVQFPVMNSCKART